MTNSSDSRQNVPKNLEQPKKGEKEEKTLSEAEGETTLTNRFDLRQKPEASSFFKMFSFESKQPTD